MHPSRRRQTAGAPRVSERTGSGSACAAAPASSGVRACSGVGSGVALAAYGAAGFAVTAGALLADGTAEGGGALAAARAEGAGAVAGAAVLCESGRVRAADLPGDDTSRTIESKCEGRRGSDKRRMDER